LPQVLLIFGTGCHLLAILLTLHPLLPRLVLPLLLAEGEEVMSRRLLLGLLRLIHLPLEFGSLISLAGFVAVEVQIMERRMYFDG
jgi:hypothetical protein